MCINIFIYIFQNLNSKLYQRNSELVETFQFKAKLKESKTKLTDMGSNQKINTRLEFMLGIGCQTLPTNSQL